LRQNRSPNGQKVKGLEKIFKKLLKMNFDASPFYEKICTLLNLGCTKLGSNFGSFCLANPEMRSKSRQTERQTNKILRSYTFAGGFFIV
jgi:hypothetical protein